MALRSVLNRLPAPLRKRAYGLTTGGAAYKARAQQARGLATASKPVSPTQTKLAIGAGVLTEILGNTLFINLEPSKHLRTLFFAGTDQSIPQ